MYGWLTLTPYLSYNVHITLYAKYGGLNAYEMYSLR